MNLVQGELVRDVRTRWSSTHLMIECALKNQSVSTYYRASGPWTTVGGDSDELNLGN
jgi:hypothetical protein